MRLPTAISAQLIRRSGLIEEQVDFPFRFTLQVKARMMLRGVRIDLESSLKGLHTLEEIYMRDLEARELSDDAIAAVNTVIRAVEGAMGKTANEIHNRFARRRSRAPYFPLATNADDFENLLEKNIPGARAAHPQIADAFERHQPYQPGKAALGWRDPGGSVRCL